MGGGDFPRTLKIATVWMVVGLAVFLGITAFQHKSQQARFQANDGVIEIRRGPDGHYHWPGSINGREVDFLIDTGATGTAMSQSLARELGLSVIGQVRSNTAGGVVTGDVVRANVALQGGVRAERLAITALAGLGDRPLLGMDVLGKLRWRQHDGVLTFDVQADRDGAR